MATIEQKTDDLAVAAINSLDELRKKIQADIDNYPIEQQSETASLIMRLTRCSNQVEEWLMMMRGD